MITFGHLKKIDSAKRGFAIGGRNWKAFKPDPNQTLFEIVFDHYTRRLVSSFSTILFLLINFKITLNVR